MPSARIAVYSVCDDVGCNAVDVLSAFDDAISDGVDIITISINGQDPSSVKDDVIAQGALHASRKGILVVQAGGNSAEEKTVASVAPWIFSVAASSTDRAIVTKVSVGNGTLLTVGIHQTSHFSFFFSCILIWSCILYDVGEGGECYKLYGEGLSISIRAQRLEKMWHQ